MYSASEFHIINTLRSLREFVGMSWNGTSGFVYQIPRVTPRGNCRAAPGCHARADRLAGWGPAAPLVKPQGETGRGISWRKRTLISLRQESLIPTRMTSILRSK